jgi:calcineurin-like phosphoesterase family protein
VSRGFRVKLWWALVGIFGCAGAPVPAAAPVPVLAPADVEVSLYLIGDAGAPDSAGEPVLEALRHDISSRGSRRVVLFLGDNAYPRGLPPPNRPGRHEAERRLAAQVHAVTDVGVSGVFVPGNHDWAKHSKEGWESIKRQEAFVDSAGGGAISFEPGGGCPGPGFIDVGRRLRLVLLDTQWWLHKGPKPRDPDSNCAADSETEVVDSLRAVLARAGGRLVVVAAHHPLVSGGAHGGHFDWKAHVFPLREIKSWLWIPLPYIGSLYPTVRQQGVSNQDVESRAYRRMIAAFRRAFAARSPALYAAGHEHNLQVIAGGAARLELVSGAGIYGHSATALPVHGTLFARKASGFARLDVARSGRSRLAIIVVDKSGRSREVFSTWVE